MYVPESFLTDGSAGATLNRPGIRRGPSGMTADRPMASIRPPTSLLKRQVVKLARSEAHVEITKFA